MDRRMSILDIAHGSIRSPRRTAVIVSLTIAVVAGACGGSSTPELVGVTREPAPPVDAVALPDLGRGGRDFAFVARPGEVLVVYFGYTNCPDVCPTTLADLRAAIARLDDDLSDRVSVAMVTVDPDRDIAVLDDYVRSFVPEAHALATSDAELLRAAAQQFGVTYDVSTTASRAIEVTHSSQLFAVDDRGRLVLIWPFGTTIDELASDIGLLLAG